MEVFNFIIYHDSIWNKIVYSTKLYFSNEKILYGRQLDTNNTREHHTPIRTEVIQSSSRRNPFTCSCLMGSLANVHLIPP